MLERREPALTEGHCHRNGDDQRDEFDAKVKIEGTPTFVINGNKYEGAADLASFDKALSGLVK